MGDISAMQAQATTKEAASRTKTNGSPMPSRIPDSAGPTMTPVWTTIWFIAMAAGMRRRSTRRGTEAMRAVFEKPMRPAASELTT